MVLRNDVIFDVGMHKGQDTAYYLHKDYKVISVEADPQLADEAKNRFQEYIQTGQLTILNIGICDFIGEKEFWICEGNSVWNSFNKKFSSRDELPYHSIHIPCLTFEQILAEYGIPFYLKVDIEGNDILCLKALRSFEEKPKYVSVELDENIEEILDIFRGLGYERFKCISQFNYFPLQYKFSMEQRVFDVLDYLLVKNKRNFGVVTKLLGKRAAGFLRRKIVNLPRTYKGWVFPFGASGSYGEETRGRWYSSDELIAIYTYFLSQKEAGLKSPFWNEKEYSFWVDIHAARD